MSPPRKYATKEEAYQAQLIKMRERYRRVKDDPETKEYYRKYHEEHLEQHKEAQKRWYAANKDAHKARMKAYHELKKNGHLIENPADNREIMMPGA